MRIVLMFVSVLSLMVRRELSVSATPLSEFKAADTYVRTRGGLETLDDDEDDD